MSTLNCLLCLHIMPSTHWKMHFFLASPADMGRISCNTTGGTASPRHGHGPAAVPRRVRDGNGDTNGVAPPGGKTAPLPFALRRGGLQVRWLPQARTMQRNMMCLLTIFQRRVTPSHGCAESFLSGKTEKVFLPEALFFCERKRGVSVMFRKRPQGSRGGQYRIRTCGLWLRRPNAPIIA